MVAEVAMVHQLDVMAEQVVEVEVVENLEINHIIVAQPQEQLTLAVVAVVVEMVLIVEQQVDLVW